MSSTVIHPAARSDGSWLARYAAALQQLNGARMAECFTRNGSYRSFLVHVQLPPSPPPPTHGYSYGRSPPPPSDPELAGRMSVNETSAAEKMGALTRAHSRLILRCLLLVHSSASELAAFTSSLKRSFASPHVEIVSQLLSSDGRTGAVEYVLSGEWSGRLSSMVVGVFDKPLRLRCIDVLHLQSQEENMDGHAADLIARADVRIDRLEFLISIGMAKAHL
jgi:hypothetical protein